MEQKDTQYHTAGNKGQSLTDSQYFAIQEKHQKMSFISKKTEKIATAMYMVTDFIPDSEPLRAQLRTIAISLMAKARALVSRASLPERFEIDEIAGLFDDATAFVQLSGTIGLVSQMNSSILHSELSKTATELRTLYGSLAYPSALHSGPTGVVLDPSLFTVELPKITPRPVPPVSVIEPDVSKGHEREHTVLYPKNDTNENKKDGSQKIASVGMKIARRNDVLNIVKSKGKVSIKDIVSVLKDTSVKTVQRELLQLVKEGVLTKEGEKRWSMYRLVS
jgi:hypothetical protein